MDSTVAGIRYDDDAVEQDPEALLGSSLTPGRTALAASGGSVDAVGLAIRVRPSWPGISGTEIRPRWGKCAPAEADRAATRRTWAYPRPATSSSRRPRSGPSKVATARSYLSIPQFQKSKSIGLTEDWIEAQSIQPY